MDENIAESEVQDFLRKIDLDEIIEIIEDVRSRSHEFGVDGRHLRMLDSADSCQKLLLVATAAIKKMKRLGGDTISICSGPLRNGGKGLSRNMQTMVNQIDQDAKSMKVFNQILFFPKIVELEKKFPEMDSMKEFFEPLLRSGGITDLKILPYHSDSENAVRELDIAKEQNMKIS